MRKQKLDRLSVRVRGIDVKTAQRLAAELPAALAGVTPRASGPIRIQVGKREDASRIAVRVARAISGGER